MYRLNWLTVSAIVAALFDGFTTYYFVAWGLGIEMNEILAPLIQHSLSWIFIYLLVRPLIIPMLPEMARNVTATYFIVVNFVFGLSNLSGILTGDYFATRLIGAAGVLSLAACVSSCVFLYHWLVTEDTRANLTRQTVWLSLVLVLFLAIEYSFYGIRWLI